MKKLIAILLALMIALSLAACSGNNSPKSNTSQSDSDPIDSTTSEEIEDNNSIIGTWVGLNNGSKLTFNKDNSFTNDSFKGTWTNDDSSVAVKYTTSGGKKIELVFDILEEGGLHFLRNREDGKLDGQSTIFEVNDYYPEDKIQEVTTGYKDVVSVESIVVSPYISGDLINTDAKIRNLSDKKIDWISISVKALDQNGDALKSFDIVVNDVDANQAVTSEGYGTEFVEYSKIESLAVTSYQLGKRDGNGTYTIIYSDSFDPFISFVFSEEIPATNPVFFSASYLWLPQSSSSEHTHEN